MWVTYRKVGYRDSTHDAARAGLFTNIADCIDVSSYLRTL